MAESSNARVSDGPEETCNNDAREHVQAKKKVTKPVREAVAKVRVLCERIDALVLEREKLVPGVTKDLPKHDLDIMARLNVTLENVYTELVFCKKRLNAIENGELEILQRHAYENEGRGATSTGQPTMHVHACTDMYELERETGVDTLRRKRGSVSFFEIEI